MLRTALKPRWLALLAAVVAVGWAFGLLGLWQLNVARDTSAAEALAAANARPPVALEEVAAPSLKLGDDAVGRTVTVSGVFDPAKAQLIAGRRLGEQTGFWVMVPLRVTSTDALLPIVRGFVTSAEEAGIPAAPDGPVTVSGMLAPSEGPPDKATSLPSGQMAKLDLAGLVNIWDTPVYEAFVFATAEQPAPAGAITRVPPPSTSSQGIALRNLAYALQWWIFAAFAVVMWWRMVRDDHRAGLLRRAADAEPPRDPESDPEHPARPNAVEANLP